MRSGNRLLYVLGACMVFVAIQVSYAQGGTDPNHDTSGGKTAEQVYKNIQVLKGIPSGEVIPAMRFITASLGVQCGFCHVEQHFDQDDKKTKQVARKMIQMVSAINQNNFENHLTVTCNSCHRGSREPVSIPAMNPQTTMAATTRGPQQPPSSLPNPDEVINKYIEASGGQSALQKITTRSETGTADFFGRQIPVEILKKSPDMRISIMRLPNGDGIEGLNGNDGWEIYPHRPVLTMSSSEIASAKIDSDLQLPLHIKQLFPDLRTATPEKIDGRDAFQLVGLSAGQPRAKFYFDEQSGLLVRLIRYSETPLGLNPLQIDYSDYRQVEGVRVPFRWTTSRPEGQFTIQLTDVKQNVAIQDAKFAKPPAPVSGVNQP